LTGGGGRGRKQAQAGGGAGRGRGGLLTERGAPWQGKAPP